MSTIVKNYILIHLVTFYLFKNMVKSAIMEHRNVLFVGIIEGIVVCERMVF